MAALMHGCWELKISFGALGLMPRPLQAHAVWGVQIELAAYIARRFTVFNALSFSKFKVWRAHIASLPRMLCANVQ